VEGNDKYLTAEMEGIKIFYPPGLRIKKGFDEIHIKMRKFLFLSWLEVEGAQAIPLYNQ
jgi:hypothetical protein